MLGKHLLILLLGLAVALIAVFSWLLYTVVRRKAISAADHSQCQCPPVVSGKNSQSAPPPSNHHGTPL